MNLETLQQIIDRLTPVISCLSADSVHRGNITTKQYRQWCRDNGRDPANAGSCDLFARETEGEIFPIPDEPNNPMMECDNCHAKFRQAEVESRCTLKGERNPMNGCTPDEYVDVCPECGAEESLEPVTTCSLCGYWPCCCDLEDES